jgi:hypothetical protein
MMRLLPTGVAIQERSCIGGRELKNPDELDFMRHDAQTAALRLRFAHPYQWEEKKEQKGQEKIHY